MFVLVAFLFASCSKNNSSHIPKDAFAVAVVDGKGLSKISNNDFLKDNEDQELIKEFKEEYSKIVELIESLQKNPDELGLLLTKRSYAFASFEEENLFLGIIIPINKKQLEKNLEMIGEELGFPISVFLETKNDIKYSSFETDKIIGWNSDVLMFLAIEGGEVDFDLLEKYLNLKEKESILANKDYKKFHKNCKDINLWISSDFVKNFEKLKKDVDKFETLTGIDLTNNYGHMHLEFKKGEINFNSSLKYNKSLQNVDLKKIEENADAIEEFIDGYMGSLNNLFNPFYSGNNDYDWDDYNYEDADNWDDYSDYFTEEEWQEFLKSLEDIE